MKVIIDADPIVYRSGFAAESHHYHLVVQNIDGDVTEAYFAPKEGKNKKRISAGKQMQDFLADPECCWEVLDKERVVVPEPKEHALHLVGQELRGIIAAISRKTGVSPTDMQVTVLLTGPGNFRETLATLKPYKGNRDALHKPYWYQAIRDYLTGQWGAHVVSGREADDEVSILGHAARDDGEKYVICTIDKDLDQVPGLHYDYRQKVFYNVNPLDGARYFWQQALSGDPTDNIPGCYKIGTERAEKIIADVIDNAADGHWPTDAQFWDRIVLEYKLSKERAGCPYAEKDATEVALENARLVYMQIKPRELWCPPGTPAQWLGEGDD